ncbi:MAG: hypothetical protein ACSLE0_23305 [Chitinophagaceae bacterium]
MKTNVKSLNINVHLKTMFKLWLEITTTFHKLTKQQISVLALFLYYHHELGKEITNNKIVWKMVFDYEVKEKIKKELDMGDAGFQNVLTRLRKKGIINDNQIVKTYIPLLEKNNNNFRVIFNFNIIDG